MNKKLSKYIESYYPIQNTKKYTLLPNGGMIVLINQENISKILIQDQSFLLKSFQAILINTNIEPIHIQSNENINLVSVRFKGAGASF